MVIRTPAYGAYTLSTSYETYGYLYPKRQQLHKGLEICSMHDVDYLAKPLARSTGTTVVNNFTNGGGRDTVLWTDAEGALYHADAFSDLVGTGDATVSL